MSTENYEKRKEALKYFREIQKKPGEYNLIHYSCESLEAPSPRIYTIVIRELGSQRTVTFSIEEYAAKEKIQESEIEQSFEKIEKKMLKEYFEYIEKAADDGKTFIHWNMYSNKYSFEAIEKRYSVLGGKPNKISSKNKFSLMDGIKDIYGSGYMPEEKGKGKGKLVLLAEYNNLSLLNSLDFGQQLKEVENGNYSLINLSTGRTIIWLKSILDRVIDKKLKHKAPLFNKVGFFSVRPAAKKIYAIATFLTVAIALYQFWEKNYS